MIHKEMLEHSAEIGKEQHLTEIDILFDKDTNQDLGYSTHRKPMYHSSHSQQLPSIYK